MTKKVAILLCFCIINILGFAQTRPDWRDVKNKPIINMADYGIVVNTDISAKLQQAINTVDGANLPSAGAEIRIPAGRYYLDTPIYVNGSGVTISGEGSLSTYLVSRQNATATIQVNPGIASLWRAQFYMRDLCMQSSTFDGYGIQIKTCQGEIKNCTFLNLKEAIVLTGCHFFSFFNNYFVACTVRAQRDVGGEGTCNQLVLHKNLFEYADLDLREAVNALVHRNDFEGSAGTPIRIGADTTFTENRLELRNLIYNPTLMATETVWLSIDGDRCKVRDNSFHVIPSLFSNFPTPGPISVTHPIIQVNSSYNEIEWARNAAYNQFAIRCEPKNPGSISDNDPRFNRIIFTTPFEDRTRSGNGVYDSAYMFTGVFRDQLLQFNRRGGESIFGASGGSSVIGDITELGTSNTLLASTTLWGLEQIATNSLTIASYPAGFSATDSALFLQCEATSTSGNRRFYLASPISSGVAATTTVTLSALVYVPGNFDGKFRVGVNLDTVAYPIPAGAGWFWVHYTTQLFPGEALRPTFGYSDNTATANTKFVIGCVSLVLGDLPAFVFPTSRGNTRWSRFSYPK